jgi:hypothetical protein
MKKSFFFEGNQIHRINQVHEDHKCVIQIGTSQFRYSTSQLAILSNKALKHFCHSELPFEISLPNQPDNQINFGLNDLVSCFKSIHSHFHSQTEIIINENNFHAFEYLSNFLDKRSLSRACKEINSNASSVFKLSLKHFKSLYENYLNKLNDFKLVVNDKTFNINFSLFCCVSDKFLSMKKQEEELICSIPEQYLHCFISFLDIFKKLPFYFESYSLESVSYLINLFGLSNLSQFICENIPLPQNVNEALEFLSKPSCEFYSNIFDES